MPFSIICQKIRSVALNLHNIALMTSYKINKLMLTLPCSHMSVHISVEILVLFSWA